MKSKFRFLFKIMSLPCFGSFGDEILRNFGVTQENREKIIQKFSKTKEYSDNLGGAGLSDFLLRSKNCLESANLSYKEAFSQVCVSVSLSLVFLVAVSVATMLLFSTVSFWMVSIIFILAIFGIVIILWLAFRFLSKKSAELAENLDFCIEQNLKEFSESTLEKNLSLSSCYYSNLE